MRSLMPTGSWRIATVFSIALVVIVEPIPGSNVLAAASSGPVDSKGDQLRDQLHGVMNAPVNFCDPAAEHAHLIAVIAASVNSAQHQLENRHPGLDDVKRAEDEAVRDARADGELVEDLPYVAAYDAAGRRGDEKTQSDLLEKMTRAARAQAAAHDHNLVLEAQILRPLADAGDVGAQVRLATIYSFENSALSSKYLPKLPDDVAAKLRPVLGKHWPPMVPPANLPLAFKYLQSAAEKGDIFGQWGLAKAYACGLRLRPGGF